MKTPWSEPVSIAELLAKVAPQSDPLHGAWAQVAGPELARVSSVSIRKGVLRVVVESPLWVQQINLLKAEWLKRLQYHPQAHGVQDIQAKVGRPGKSKTGASSEPGKKKRAGDSAPQERRVVTSKDAVAPEEVERCQALNSIVDAWIEEMDPGDLREALKAYLVASLR